MVTAEQFLGACRARGLSFFTGTPCSYLKPLINGALNDAALGFRDAVNEGDAVAFAAGAYLATGAPACGYARAVGTDSLAGLAQELAAHAVGRGPTLVHFRTRPGTLAKLGRPKISPAEAKTRLMQWLNLS